MVATKQNKETVETADAKIAETFSKEQIIASKMFVYRRDLLNVLLEDGKEYTVEDVKKIMDDWYKKGVK